MKFTQIFLITAVLTLLIFSCTPFKSVNVPADVNLAEAIDNASSDTLAFEITEANNIIFKAIINETDTLDFYLDTGGTEIVMSHKAVKEKTTFLDRGRNSSYKEENYEPLDEYFSMALGEMSWDSLTIYPTALIPKEADGHFGWNLFEDKVLELDYDKNLMIVHSSFTGNLEDYAKMEIEYINTLFCIQSSIRVGENTYPNRYLFDSGFQRAVVLDRDLRAQSNFPDDLPVIKESKLKNSEGTEFVNRVVEVDQICFAEACANNVPVQLFATPNPARFETHILGNELLKRFNTILDFQNDYVYMKANSLIDLPYKDAS